MTSNDTQAPEDTQSRAQRARVGIQRFGGHLAAMVMPNIGAFIAWGLITAMFIPSGWIPNETIGELVGPMITFLLPTLIGYTGGRLVHGQRGAVVGAIATFGVIVGAEIPMFLGAMIVGPLGGLLIKLWDEKVGVKVAPGFKMLVDNFSAGIIGGALAVGSLFSIGPVVEGITKALGNGVQWLLDLGVLPLVSVIVEPAKILFLNNAINHGVLSPLGVAEALANGKAIHFLIEANPGPGLGVLAALSVFGPRAARATAPGAIVIQFLGGIHEIYFPYILANPKLLLSVISGGAAGVLTFSVLDAGLVATPSPGSIIALMAVTPKGGHVAVIAGVLAAAVVAFVVAAALMKFGRDARREERDQQIANGGAVTA